MAWFSSTTRRLKVLISGKTLKSPDKKLTSGLNLNPKVSRTKHVVAGILFHLKENESAQLFRLLVCQGPDAHLCGLGLELLLCVSHN